MGHPWQSVLLIVALGFVPSVAGFRSEPILDATEDLIVDPQVAAKFDGIATTDAWGSKESISGHGSEKDSTKFIVQFLDKFIKKHEIKKLIDIPCGDANWQFNIHSIQTSACEYYGADVSSVALQKARNSNANRTYMKFAAEPFDWTTDELVVEQGQHTLIMMKHVLQHLPLEMGIKAIKNAKMSGAKYLAVTNHDKELWGVQENGNVQLGGMYHNNMFMAPFSFTNQLADIADDLIADGLNSKEVKKYGNFMIFDLSAQRI